MLLIKCYLFGDHSQSKSHATCFIFFSTDFLYFIFLQKNKCNTRALQMSPKITFYVINKKYLICTLFFLSFKINYASFFFFFFFYFFKFIQVLVEKKSKTEQKKPKTIKAQQKQMC